jgi:hypothetical protein
MTTTETPTALDAARNAFRNMMAHVQYVVDGDEDPEKALLAHVHNVSARADQDSKVAARMALVSIAEDLRRIAGHLTGWQADWELVARDGEGNAVLKHKETGGRYRVIPEEDL